MNKKIRNALLLVVLVLACLALFVGCNNKQADIFEYSEDDIGPIGLLIRWMHGWIGNYGWTVVVFTVFLKLIMLPLDFWQRYASRKSTLKMQQMQPVIEEIDRRYGANTQRSNEEKQKLYKKQGFSMMSTCLPMILSMVIFFVMFAGLRNYSTYSSVISFRDLSNIYYDTYAEQIENDSELKEYYQLKYGEIASETSSDVTKLTAKISAVSETERKYETQCAEYKKIAETAVQDYYEEHHESWLWIQNVWQPDTWVSIMPDFETKGSFSTGFSATVNMKGYPDGTSGKGTYQIIKNAVIQTGSRGDAGKWNGLMILPFMSIGLSFLSMFISQRLERKNRKGQVVQNKQQQTSNTMMMILMPLMMAWFGFIYTGAFAIYMVCNYMISILTTIGMRYPVEKILEKQFAKQEQKNNSGKASYMR